LGAEASGEEEEKGEEEGGFHFVNAGVYYVKREA
jgi:hypothetical protein